MTIHIPFNKPAIVGSELTYIGQAIAGLHASGDGPFTKRAQALLEKSFEAPRVLLTTSCTSALELAALLCDLRPGDEVIVPSYTFVSTANAFVLRGAKPVFVDIRPDTLNIDEQLIEEAITPRTRAICQALGSDMLISADANQGFTVDEALRYVCAVDGAGLDFFEQPVMADDLSGMESVQASTAIAIGAEADMGTLEPGKLANFVALTEDPTADLAALRTVTDVVKRGRRYERAAYVHPAQEASRA